MQNLDLDGDGDEYSASQNPGFEPTVVLVERGNCSFVSKVRNIANMGGAIAVIIDTLNEDIKDVILSDDGTGAGIRIPAILIGSKQGNILKDYYLE